MRNTPPRTCGEYILIQGGICPNKKIMKLPPPHLGNIRLWELAGARPLKHPTARGEYRPPQQPRQEDWETTPRTWGISSGSNSRHQWHRTRNNPTHVGGIWKTKVTKGRKGETPHARGEYENQSSEGAPSGRRKHPHALVEYQNICCAVNRLRETHPRTWGEYASFVAPGRYVE